MMTEISLNVSDVLENPTRAGTSLATILVTTDTDADKLIIVIADNGCGVTPEQAAYVTDPFFTTRTTRKVELGIPSLKYTAKSIGSSFHIESEPDKETAVTVVSGLSHIDRMPLGDMNATTYNLIVYHPDTDFLYARTYNGVSFTLNTRQMREILGGTLFNTPEVPAYIVEYLKENQQETDGSILTQKGAAKCDMFRTQAPEGRTPGVHNEPLYQVCRTSHQVEMIYIARKQLKDGCQVLITRGIVAHENSC